MQVGRKGREGPHWLGIAVGWDRNHDLIGTNIHPSGMRMDGWYAVQMLVAVEPVT